MTKSLVINVVAGCVLEKGSRYLLVQEKKESAYEQWNLPAGRVDEDETLQQAAAREVYEETGFTVEVLEELCVEHPSAKRPVLHSFKANILGGDLKIPANELLDARWFTYAEIKQLQADGKLRVDWVVRSIEACR